MNSVLDILLATPAVLPALTSALIAAAVAIFVMAVSQYLIFKKGRTDFLTPKLEQLYLLLNELSEHNVTQFRLHFDAMSGDDVALSKISEIDDLDLYGHRRAKKIIMYVRLYFPRLSRAHQLLFAAERELNLLQHAIVGPTPPDPEDFLLASGQVGHFLMLMEQELIRNRDLLLHANVLPRRYKSTTSAEIANMSPPPTGQPFGPSPQASTGEGEVLREA